MEWQQFAARKCIMERIDRYRLKISSIGSMGLNIMSANARWAKRQNRMSDDNFVLKIAVVTKLHRFISDRFM